jgi:hypothetical protein
MTIPFGSRAIRPSIGESDLPLVLEVLRANTALEHTLYTVLSIERVTRYPIQTLDELRACFPRSNRIPLGKCTLRPQDLGNCLPKEAFPIETREELVSHLTMGFHRLLMTPIQQIADYQEGAEIIFNVEDLDHTGGDHGGVR